MIKDVILFLKVHFYSYTPFLIVFFFARALICMNHYFAIENLKLVVSYINIKNELYQALYQQLA